MTNSNQTTPGALSSSPSPSLRRGQACLSCRRRKTKCDAARPACTSCIREGLQATCEYQPPSNETLELGRRVRELRSRLRELERTRVASEGTQASTSVSPVTSVRRVEGTEFPSQRDRERLLSAFFSDEQPLWFLHRERFRTAVAPSASGPEQVHPALVASVCALGARSAAAGALATWGLALLDVALSSVHRQTNLGDPQYALQLMQARILLGGALMDTGQALQGASVLSGACSLALDLGLHNPYATMGGIAIVPVPIGRLLPPTTGVDAAERAGAFWVAATLDRLWALALGNRPRINLDALEVHAPWLRRPEYYEQAGQESFPPAIHSLRELLRGTGSTSAYRMDVGNSVEAIVTAAYLYEKSVMLSRGTSEADTSMGLNALVTRADSLAAAFAQHLGAASNTLMLAAFVLVCGVSIKLFSRSGDVRAINASRALVSAAPTFHTAPSGPGFLEVAIGMVIPQACLTLASSAGRNMGCTSMGGTGLEVGRSGWQALRGVLEHWAMRSAYVRSRLERMQQELVILGLS